MSDIIPIVPAPTSVNACDVMKGPCACGAWHVMPLGPPKTLLLAAKELRAAQRAYMEIRDSGDVVLKAQRGQAVADAADELDRSIEATERRQAPPQEPDRYEQAAMGVHPSGGELLP